MSKVVSIAADVDRLWNRNGHRLTIHGSGGRSPVVTRSTLHRTSNLPFPQQTRAAKLARNSENNSLPKHPEIELTVENQTLDGLFSPIAIACLGTDTKWLTSIGSTVLGRILCTAGIMASRNIQTSRCHRYLPL